MDMISGRPSFFFGRSVLVTGHTGFKGIWLTRWLTLMGARVLGFAQPPMVNHDLCAWIAEGIQSMVGDVRDLTALLKAFNEHRPEIVLHLAAQSLVRRSYREPVQTYATNVMGTLHVLECCRLTASVRAVVVVTSDKCYESRIQKHGYREDDPIGGDDPYSSSKGCAELLTASYRRSFLSRRVAVASARAGNVIGGGDFAEDRLVPDIVRGALSGEPTQLRYPLSVRPWQHVLDPLAGYLLLAKRLCESPDEYSEAWNLGPSADDAVSVERLAREFTRRLGRGRIANGSVIQSSEFHEAPYLNLDSSKARVRLGWAPRLSFVEAVDLAARWYRLWIDNPQSGREELDAQIQSHGPTFE